MKKIAILFISLFFLTILSSGCKVEDVPVPVETMAEEDGGVKPPSITAVSIIAPPI